MEIPRSAKTSLEVVSDGVRAPEFATYEMRNPKPGKGLGYFVA